MTHDDDLPVPGGESDAVEEASDSRRPKGEDAADEPSAPATAAAHAGDGTGSPDEDPARGAHKEHHGRKHHKKTSKEAVEQLESRVTELDTENEALRAEVRDLKDKWLRSAAEFENFRKRTRKEWELLQQRTKAEVILDILAVVDDFERAFAVAGDRDDDFVRGIRLIYNNLKMSLENIGVRKIESLHTAFDPAYHMAVAHIEREGANSNHVVEVVQEGYCLGDLVIRPARVVIAK